MLPRDTLNVPVLVLLAFAAWTVLTLCGSVAVYRWSRILTGRVAICVWRADLQQGSEWYQRAMRAHMNCIENLPVYGAIVLALMAGGARSAFIDHLSVLMMAARICQTLVHIVPPVSNTAASLRFGFFFIQVACMTGLGVIAAAGLVTD